MSFSTQSNSKKAASKRWVITAVTFLMLAMFPVSYLLYKKTNDIKAELASYNETVEEVEEETANSILNENFVVTESKIILPNHDTPAIIKVYWQSENIFLLINALPILAADEQFEVWRIAEGKRNSLGLFNTPETGKLIIKVTEASITDTYDIKIIKKDIRENGVAK